MQQNQEYHFLCWWVFFLVFFLLYTIITQDEERGAVNWCFFLHVTNTQKDYLYYQNLSGQAFMAVVSYLLYKYHKWYQSSQPKAGKKRRYFKDKKKKIFHLLLEKTKRKQQKFTTEKLESDYIYLKKY